MTETEKFPPPDDLDAASKRLWKATISELDDMGVLCSSDIHAVERYVRALQIARRAREAMIGPDGELMLTSTGSAGQSVPHPALRVMREATRDAHDFAGSLLLTPASRKRAGIVGPRWGADDPFSVLDALDGLDR